MGIGGQRQLLPRRRKRAPESNGRQWYPTTPRRLVLRLRRRVVEAGEPGSANGVEPADDESEAARRRLAQHVGRLKPKMPARVLRCAAGVAQSVRSVGGRDRPDAEIVIPRDRTRRQSTRTPPTNAVGTLEARYSRALREVLPGYEGSLVGRRPEVGTPSCRRSISKSG